MILLLIRIPHLNLKRNNAKKETKKLHEFEMQEKPSNDSEFARRKIQNLAEIKS